MVMLLDSARPAGNLGPVKDLVSTSNCTPYMGESLTCGTAAAEDIEIGPAADIMDPTEAKSTRNLPKIYTYYMRAYMKTRPEGSAETRRH